MASWEGGGKSAADARGTQVERWVSSSESLIFTCFRLAVLCRGCVLLSCVRRGKTRAFPSLYTISILGSPEHLPYQRGERKYHCSPHTQTIRGKSTRTTTQALSPVQCMRRSKVPCRHHHQQHHTSLISKPWYIMLRGFIYYQLSPTPDAPARVAGGAVSIYIIQLAGSPARPLNVHFPFGRRRDVPPSLSPSPPPPPSKKTQTPDMQIPDVPCLKSGNH